MRGGGPYYSLARPVFETIEGYGESLPVDAPRHSFNTGACVSVDRAKERQCGMQIFRARAAPRINVLFAQNPQALTRIVVWP